MRVWKKISAMAAMAAMCVSLAVPAAASAEEINARIGGCGGDCKWISGVGEEEISSEKHIHAYWADVMGHIMIFEYECEMKTIREFEYKACQNCGIVMRVKTLGEYITHSINEKNKLF